MTLYKLYYRKYRNNKCDRRPIRIMLMTAIRFDYELPTVHCIFYNRVYI